MNGNKIKRLLAGAITGVMAFGLCLPYFPAQEAYAAGSEAAEAATSADSLCVRRGNAYYFSYTIHAGDADKVVYYGKANDEVLVGDWDGDGVDTICVRRGNAYYFKNDFSGGNADTVVYYGKATDEVLVGDWDGDGKDTLAVRRGNAYYISNSVKSGKADKTVYYGKATDTVLAGDWDGDGKDTLAVRRENAYYISNTIKSGNADKTVYYGKATDIVLVGDWDGDGKDTLAVRRGNLYYISNTIKSGIADKIVPYGKATDEVYAGCWQDNASTSHDYEVTNTVDATCTDAGSVTYTCKDCEATYTTTIAALGHNYELTGSTSATCSAAGSETYTCTRCGETYTKTTDKAEHEYETTETVEASDTEDGYVVYTCKNCGDTYTETIPATSLVFDLVVSDGVATDLVTGTTYPGITVSGDYMYEGNVSLPSSYTQWTYEMIVDYNEESTSGVISSISYWSNSGKYEECSDVFRLNEVNSISNRGSVCIPWVKDSWNTGYTVTIPVQLYAHVSADYEYLPEGDTFWSFSMDSENGTLLSRIDGATATTTMSTYTNDDGDTVYVNKKFPSSFTLTGAHAIKEIRFYDTAISADAQEQHYEAADIEVPASGMNQVVDGLTGLGSSLYYTRTTGEYPVMQESETEAGTYTIEAGTSKIITYTISDYEQPDNGIDNSVYESVHIMNEPETITVGKQYPLTAYPYPFDINGSDDGTADEFDIEWSSSDSDVLTVMDGLLIAKKAGTAKVTATLMGTDISDTVTIKVMEEEEKEDIAWYVPENYVSADGDSFSDTDYEMTTRAIYAAIDEAAEDGYNHIIFPQINFYAVPITDSNGYALKYYVPTNMTIEFPEGSVFYMMDNELSRGDPTKVEIHYFEFGVPNSDYENTCEDSHLIMDTYYGERYNTTYSEDDYLEEMRFVEFGRKAVNCSVEITNAYYPTGYFITADGTCNTNKTTGVMNYGDFVSGWLNEDGELEENENWISTDTFITVPDYGSDGYFISADGQDSYAGKYWGGCSARQYDILWYDADYNLIQTDRFQGRGDYYDIPEDAVYFKVSLQQSSLPTPGSSETEDSPWIAMHDDGSAKMCELKNTNVYNSATGLFSVVGETDGLWIHNCYTNRDGMKPLDERTGDFENGWVQTRHSVVSNCFLTGYFGNPGSYNTFIHTCYMTNYSGFSGETEMLRFINNTCDWLEISEKCQAHIYYNTIYGTGIDRFNTSIGHTYKANNTSGQWVRSY